MLKSLFLQTFLNLPNDMQDKLQELTDRLYNEGLNKGKEEGERILLEARKKADEITASAKEEADRIIAEAQKQAEELKSKVASDLKTASAQCLQATRQDVENVLSEVKPRETLSDPDFLKKLITAVAEGLSAGQQARDLDLVLPETLRDSLESWVQGELSAKLKSSVSASFSKKVAGGFTIAPRGDGWYLSFTDESFDALIREYLRPVTRKLIFGK